MIRDEFIKQSETLTTKEINGIRQQGERAFYSSSIINKNGMVKGLNFSTSMTLILAVLLTIIVVFRAITIDNYYTQVGFYVLSAFALAIYIWNIVWFFIWRPAINKTIAKYKQKIKELNYNQLEKQKAIQNFLKNNKG